MQINFPSISNLIPSQFPEVYREDGPTFVAFVKAYYEWLEQNHQVLLVDSTTGFEVGSVVTQDSVTGKVAAIQDNNLLLQVNGYDKLSCSFKCSDQEVLTTVTNGTKYSTKVLEIKTLGVLFNARNLSNYKNIDSTIDSFINEFKKKYLRNIDFDSMSNKTLFIKNALSFYRSKGTDRSIDLFFRLIYGTNSEVVRPADFLFQPSGATWSKPTYLEISPDTVDRAISLVGKEITGVTSGAKAFVEKYIKLKTNFGFSHVLFVSNVKGSFIVKELIKDLKVFSDSPTIYGSLNAVQISSPTFEFEVGDLVPLETFTGINGLARVSEIRFATGQVEFELEDGGYGYTTNALNPSVFGSKTLVSDHLLSVSNVQLGNVITSISVTDGGSGYSNSDTVTFTSTLGRSAYGRLITDPSGVVLDVELLDKGTGFDSYLVNTFAIDTDTGDGSAEIVGLSYFNTKYVSLLEPIYQLGNPDAPEAFVTSLPKTVTLEIDNITGAFVEGDKVYQVDSTLGIIASGIISKSIVNLTKGTITLTELTGAFRIGAQVLSNRAGASAVLLLVDDLQFSVKLTSTERFAANVDYQILANTSGMIGSILSVSSGVNANVFITAIDDTEEVRVNTDLLKDIDLSTRLDANTYNLSQDPNANLESFLFESLTFNVLTVGKIKSIGAFNPGNNYNVSPEVLVFQPYLSSFDKNDIVFKIDDLNGAFSEGELVEQVYGELTYTVNIANTQALRIGEPVFATNNVTSEIVLNGKVTAIPSNTIVELQNLVIANSNPLSLVNTTLRSEVNDVFAQNILFTSASEQVKISRARVKSFDTEKMFAERLSFEDTYKAGERLLGQFSGVSANVLSFSEDANTQAIGLNAEISSLTITANGTIANLQVLDSGFGFVNGQESTFVSPQGRVGRFVVVNGGLGTGSGSYESIKGFLSDRSKLFDGNYYQEYSYDIFSKIPIEKYGSMFKEVLHTAGTQFFGTVLIDTVLDVSAKNRDLLITGDSLADPELPEVVDSEIIVSNTSPQTLHSVNIFRAPEPWKSTTTRPNIRVDLAPVIDRSRVNIETRA